MNITTSAVDNVSINGEQYSDRSTFGALLRCLFIRTILSTRQFLFWRIVPVCIRMHKVYIHRQKHKMKKKENQSSNMAQN